MQFFVRQRQTIAGMLRDNKSKNTEVLNYFLTWGLNIVVTVGAAEQDGLCLTSARKA